MTSIEIIQHCVENREEMLVCTDLASQTSQQIYQARQDLLSYYEKHSYDLEAIILVLRHTKKDGYRVEYMVDKMFQNDDSIIDVQIHGIAKKGKLVLENIFPHTDKYNYRSFRGIERLITNNQEINLSQLITVMTIEAEKPCVKSVNQSKPEKRKCEIGGNTSKEISKAPKAETNPIQSKSQIEEELQQQFVSVNQSKRIKIMPKQATSMSLAESNIEKQESNNQNMNSGQIQQEIILVEKHQPQEPINVSQPLPSKSQPVPSISQQVASKKPNVQQNKNIMSFFVKK